MKPHEKRPVQNPEWKQILKLYPKQWEAHRPTTNILDSE